MMNKNGMTKVSSILILLRLHIIVIQFNGVHLFLKYFTHLSNGCEVLIKNNSRYQYTDTTDLGIDSYFRSNINNNKDQGINLGLSLIHI